MPENKLFYGDNLEVLREHVRDETEVGVRNKTRPAEVLDPHAQLSVRVGGWNAPFVTFSREQQQNYLKRGLD